MVFSRLALAGAFSLAAGAATAASYTLTDLGGLPFGANITQAHGINDSGQVIGSRRILVSGLQFADRPFLWEDGTVIGLGGLPGGFANSAHGINDSGQVVGSSSSTVGSRAFLWDSGTMTDLGVLPGDSSSSARGINNSGQVVGHSINTTCPPGILATCQSIRAVLWDSGTMIELGGLPGGANLASARSINDSGQVVGYSGATNGERAFLWDSGIMTDLGDGDMSFDFDVNADGQIVGYSDALDINDSGQIVGYRATAAGNRAFVWDAIAGMQDLNDLIDPTIGWILKSARGINASGQIVGNGFNGSATRGFLLTPVSTTPPGPPPTAPIPVPAGLPLLAAALGGLAWVRRRG